MKQGIVIVVVCLLSGMAFAQGRTALDGRGSNTNTRDRSASRMDDLEMQIQNLQMQVNNLPKAAPAPSVSREEVEALRREVAELRAENRQLRKMIDELGVKVEQMVRRPPPPPPPPPTNNDRPQVGYEHTVERGQTLSDIALAYGVKVNDIVRDNNLKDANTLREGQKLFIRKQ